MRAATLTGGILAGAIALAGPAAACSYCGDPDLVSGGPAAPAGPALTADDLDQGFYIVTKAYVGDTVTITGDLTSYGIRTVDVTPTTVARDVSVVQSGQPSPFDGTSTNSRPTLSDGRPVGGTYVDSFRIDAGGNKVFVGRTFLADDSELAKDAARAATGSAAPAQVAVPVPAQIPAPEAPQPPPAAAPDPRTPSSDGPTAPEIVPPDAFVLEPDVPRVREWLPRDGDDDPYVPSGPSSPPSHTRDVRAGVAVAPQADVLSRIEILRGRRVALWIRATVDGSPARVLAWRLVSGEVTALGPLSGAGDDPFVALWPAVGRPSDGFVIRFDAVVDVGGGSARSAPASINVIVRSPALVE